MINILEIFASWLVKCAFRLWLPKDRRYEYDEILDSPGVIRLGWSDDGIIWIGWFRITKVFDREDGHSFLAIDWHLDEDDPESFAVFEADNFSHYHEIKDGKIIFYQKKITIELMRSRLDESNE